MSHHLDTPLAAQNGQLFIDDLYVFPGEGHCGRPVTVAAGGREEQLRGPERLSVAVGQRSAAFPYVVPARRRG